MLNTTISTFLSQLNYGSPITCENLTIVPLLDSQNVEPEYLTMEEGLSTSLFQIEELEDGAQVNDIQFRNTSEKFALLFEGEELLGAKQNRILNISVLIKPKTDETLPVSCVEAGRWHHNHRDRAQQRFRSANRMHYARGRAFENRAVSMNLASHSEFRSNQAGVWDGIAEKSRRLGAHSPSSASEAMFVSTQPKIQTFLDAFEPQPNQIGSVFLVDGQVSGMEIFKSEKTHKSLMPKLVQSYALDAIDSTLSRKSDEKVVEFSQDQLEKTVKEFTSRFQTSETNRFDGIAEGENFRFTGKQLTGSALIHEEQVFHLCAFDFTEEEGELEEELV